MTTKTRKAPTTDPIFAAIAEHKRLAKESTRLYGELGDAEGKASKKHGHRPNRLIAWRSYPMIGGSKIERARDAFLSQPGVDREQIEREYLDAKARYAATEYEGIAWDHRTGLAQLRKQAELALRAENRAATQMARTKPTTPAGAGALVDYIRRDIKDNLCSWNWPTAALKTVAASLSQMKKEAA